MNGFYFPHFSSTGSYEVPVERFARLLSVVLVVCEAGSILHERSRGIRQLEHFALYSHHTLQYPALRVAIAILYGDPSQTPLN